MAQNFLACDREQELLLPPSLREWLPENHLAWFVIDAVAQVDLTAFYAAYRADGHGRAAHDPAMVVVLCAEAGLVQVGVIAVDGTKVHANASEHATRNYEQLAREILAEADAVDREEDERFGERRGDELPEHLATGAGRAKWLAEAKRRLEQRRGGEAPP